MENRETPNSAPIAVADSYEVLHDDALNVSAAGVLANDTDADQDPLEAVEYSQPSHALYFLLDSTGSFDYIPEAGFVGTDEFWYTAFDGQDHSDPVKVTIEVTNTTPVGEEDYFSTFVDESLSVSAANGVLANDWDSDDDPLIAEIYSYPSNASYFNLNSDGSFDYVPSYQFQGQDSFIYRVFDGAAYSAFVTATILVQAQPGPNVRVWEGDVSWHWDTAGNWRGNAIPGPGNDVLISLSAPNGFYPDTRSVTGNAPLDVTVRSITVANTNANQGPDVQGSKVTEIAGTLTLTGAGGVSHWRFKDMDIVNANGLTISNDFTWHSGNMLSSNGNGTINVYDSEATAKLTITEAASILEADLNIGAANGLDAIAGQVVLVNMNGNLTIRKDADINVSLLGELFFDQDLWGQQSGSKGGIVRADPIANPPSPNSEINNSGLVLRGGNNDEGQYVEVGIPLINDSPGEFKIFPRQAIRFNAPHRTYDVVQNDGSIVMDWESRLIVPNGGLKINDGSVLLRSDQLETTTNITITGIITMEEGSEMTFGNVTGHYVNLITTTFNMYGGTIFMRVDGDDDSAGHNDKITATTITIDDSDAGLTTLDITVEGNLDPIQTWTVLDASNPVTGDFFDYNFHGQNLNAFWISNHEALVIQAPIP